MQPPVKGRLKRLLFDALPMMPIAECLERSLRFTTVRRVKELETAAVNRALAALGGPVRADVVTVIATYRRPDLLRRAVESALAQPVDDHRIVVVDDGGGHVPEFDSPRVHVIELADNIGVCGVVRNVGIRVSESRYVAFLDDDNRWRDDHLSRAMAKLSGGADFSYSGVELVDVNGRSLGVTNRSFSRAALRHTNFVDASSIVARRSPDVLFSRLPRTKGGARHEDWEFAYRLSRRGDVVHVSETTVEYLDNPGSHYRHVAGADESSGARTGRLA